MSLIQVERTHTFVVEADSVEEAETLVTANEGSYISNDAGAHETTYAEVIPDANALAPQLRDKEPANGYAEKPAGAYFE